VGSVIYERLSWKLKIGEPSDFGGFLLLILVMKGLALNYYGKSNNNN
jgi:hypothetical protein